MSTSQLEPAGLPPREVDRRLRSTEGLLLVCAYAAESGFKKFGLPAAISLQELQSRCGALDRDTELVFYCRCPEDKTAREVAREYRGSGFSNVCYLLGGHKAWIQAGLPG